MSDWRETLRSFSELCCGGNEDVAAAIDAALKEIDRLTARANNLQHELLDLITLMPDTQTQEIIDYIVELRAIRARKSEAR